ncbi:glycosyltransferase family 2 protein [uncultured Bacteroides sp.]|uniref:glycosyltransferase family 2 protein n=1 Tax=uncultured Bacteroides sp. TaxID=162156 RepID=UPI002599E827|nr:glycosyltransferase family 2 protein [uncultured Bacteroides sp.]
MKKISILIPTYNEEKSLPLLYPELKKLMDEQKQYEWEILFVNDGSCDSSLNIIKALRAADDRINFISLSRNFGKETAMLAGFDYVTGDCMVIMDADLQDPPSLITQMLEYWEQGYDDVYAKRANRGKESWLRKRFSLLFYKILETTTRFEVLQNVGDFRLLDRCCINALKQIRESERYTKGMFCWIGYNKKEIVFNRGDRIAGESNWNFKSLFNLAIEGITSFTTAPLRFASVIGFFIAFFSFIAAIFYFFKTVFFGDVARGFTTLIVVVLFLGGIQLICIGILGEYIGRIFNETKRRPPYLIREYNDELIK